MGGTIEKKTNRLLVNVLDKPMWEMLDRVLTTATVGCYWKHYVKRIPDSLLSLESVSSIRLSAFNSNDI